MRNAIRNVLKRSKNGARTQMNIAETGRAGDEPDPAPSEGDAVRISGWRRALRDNDGHVAASEYVLMLAALALWGAIILEAGEPRRFARMFEWCPSIAGSVLCGAREKAAKVNSAASLEVTAKGALGPKDAFKRPMEGEKDQE